MAAAALGRGGRLQRVQWRTGVRRAASRTSQRLPPGHPPATVAAASAPPAARAAACAAAPPSHPRTDTREGRASPPIDGFAGPAPSPMGFSTNHARSPARLRLHEPVSGRESATRVTHPAAYDGAGGCRGPNGQQRGAVSQRGLNQWAVGCGGVTDRGLGLRLPRGRAQRDAGSRGWAGVVAPQPAQPAPGAAASAAQRAPGPPATLAPAASQLRDWPRPRRRRDGQRRRRQEGQRAGER